MKSPKVYIHNVLGDAAKSYLLVSPLAIQRSCVERGSKNADLGKFGYKCGQRIKDSVFMETS